jgi:ribonuclease HI
VYSIFAEEDNIPLENIDLDDDIWHMHFDGSFSSEDNGDGITLVSPVGKIHNLSYILEFACTNNVAKFEALLLGIENAFNIGCGHLSVFRNYELVVNLTRKISPLSNKLMGQYSQTVWALVSIFLSFNITQVKKEFNSMAKWLAIFAATPNQQLLPHKPDCAFQYLLCPYIPEKEGSWEAIPNDEIICVVIQNEPLEPKEIISIENNKIPEGLTPLDSSFSLIVVGNKEKKREEELREKVIETILLNIRTFEPSTNVKINFQCSGKEEMRFIGLLSEPQKVFFWFYEDIRGLDPGLVQHIMKLARKKQELVSSALEAPFRTDLRDFLRTGMFFSAHPEWVSIWKSALRTTDNIITRISLLKFRQEIIRNPFPLLNMEIFLQQVVEPQLRSLLDSLLGYKKIKVKGERVYKTTFLTNRDTMPASWFT